MYLQTVSPNAHVGQFFVGQEFETREGGRIVGKGKITKVIRPDFAYWDYGMFHQQFPSHCNPYDLRSIDGFIADFRQNVGNLAGLQGLKFIKSISDKNQMLLIHCVVKDQSVAARPLLDEICTRWREFLTGKNVFYKTELHHLEGKCTVELSFATWHDMYLTGKIIVTELS